MSIKMLFLVAMKYKIRVAVILVVVLGGGWYYFRPAATATVRYVTAPVTRGTLVSSVSGSGQVSALNQVDLKPEVSARVIKVLVTPGQEVSSSAIIAYLDATDAYKNVRDAKLNLQSAQLAYQKLVQAADPLTLTQAENALTQATQNKQIVLDNLTKAYDDAFTSISDAFLDLPGVMAGMNTDLFNTGIVSTQWNIDFYSDAVLPFNTDVTRYRTELEESYRTARDSFNASFANYKSISRASDKATLEAAVDQSYLTTKAITEALKSASTYIQFYKDQMTQHGQRANTGADTHLSDLAAYTSKANSHLSDLLSMKKTLQSDKDAIINADQAITERTQSLDKIKNGPDTLDVQSQQLSLAQREASYNDVVATLSKYTLKAPIAGVIAALTLKVGDTAGSGSTAATIVSHQKLAIISLNEVDVAKVALGQKATLTFDAIEGLTLTGEVTEIDTIGTVSQGVVSYNVKIGFDTQDDSIKSGMSVSAAIITDVKQDVLMVPNSAVSTQGGQSTVQVLVNGQPVAHTVTVDAANDTSSAISGDIAENDPVVTQTITATAATAAAGAGGGLGGLGAITRGFGGGGGGGGRAGGAAAGR